VIGLIDSGLGGLTVVRRVRERLPHADLLFFADQAHVPYGDRTADDLYGLLQTNLAWLDERGPDAIVMACNTSCAIADVYGWPHTRATVFDLIDSATRALEHGRHRRIGVVATAATVKSGAYGRRIRARLPGTEVVEVAAPALVPLVEAGKIEGDEARAAVRAVCEQLPRDVDAVVLACTHYPVLDAHFAAALGKDVARIDPAFVQAERVAALLGERATEGGRTRYVTNAALEVFHFNVSRIMGEPNPQTETLAPV
jgi:glutamate racemase